MWDIYSFNEDDKFLLNAKFVIRFDNKDEAENMLKMFRSGQYLLIGPENRREVQREDGY